MKGAKIFLKNRKTKNENMAANDTKGNEKQKLYEYRKKYYKIWKNKTTS